VNRIAAGECIERPASVVKELVENALDAGADRVDITIHDGGRELIRVVDDGTGMSAADLALCIHPHATSKIRGDDDLFDIHTMGFRGEALPSIGSVSRLEITSRTQAEDVAYTIRVDAGVAEQPRPSGAAVGTRVEVRDLFYAVPARRKFLRTNQTEMGHITEQLARIALAHPSVAFSLRHQNRLVHELPPSAERLKRISDFYSPELAEALLPIRREGNGVIVEGFVAPPKESRGSSKWEYVFVNGRYVRDRFVSHAVKSAYRSLIDPSRFPVAFLFISIAPEQIDVNVHPTKVEVRWRDSNYIHGQVLAAIREKFLATNLDHSLSTRHASEDTHREGVRRAMVDFFTHNAPDRSDAQLPTTRPDPRSPIPVPQSPIPVPQSPIPDPRSPIPSTPPAAVQIHNMYIVAQTDDGLMIVDQHALHERILYEGLKTRIAEKPLESQRLLIPEIVKVPADRIAALDTHADLLARLGLELTPSGPQSVTLHAFPSLLERADRVRFVKDLLDRLAEPGARPSTETLIHELLDMMACKAAVKFGDELNESEIAALLNRRENAERSSHCPHGRPTTLHLTLRDLERQFKRR